MATQKANGRKRKVFVMSDNVSNYSLSVHPSVPRKSNHEMFSEEVVQQICQHVCGTVLETMDRMLDTRLAPIEERLKKVEERLIHRSWQQNMSMERVSSVQLAILPPVKMITSRRKKLKEPLDIIGSVTLKHVSPLTNRSSPFLLLSKMDSRTPINSVWQHLFHHNRIVFKKPMHVTAEIAKLTTKHVSYMQKHLDAYVQKQLDHFEEKHKLTAESLFVKWENKHVHIIRYPENASWGKWHYDITCKCVDTNNINMFLLSHDYFLQSIWCNSYLL